MIGGCPISGNLQITLQIPPKAFPANHVTDFERGRTLKFGGICLRSYILVVCIYTYTLHLCKILPVWLNNKNLYRLTQKTSIAQKNFVSGFSRVSQPTCPIIHSWKPQTNCFLVLSLDSRLSNTMGSLKAGPQHSCLQQVTF